MAVRVSALRREVPVFQATRAGRERQPVLPQMPSWSISAMMSTIRPSMALRCPVNSANSSNSTPIRSTEIEVVAIETM